MEGHKKVNLLELWIKIKDNQESSWCKFGISLILFFILILVHFTVMPFINCKVDISNIFVTVFTGLLGFSIAAYAILLSLSHKIIEILNKPFLDENNKRSHGTPFNVLTASFAYSCLILMITVFLSLFAWANSFLFYILMLFASYSFVLSFDLIFHLYATSYYLITYKPNIKKENDNK